MDGGRRELTLTPDVTMKQTDHLISNRKFTVPPSSKRLVLDEKIIKFWRESMDASNDAPVFRQFQKHFNCLLLFRQQLTAIDCRGNIRENHKQMQNKSFFDSIKNIAMGKQSVGCQKPTIHLKCCRQMDPARLLSCSCTCFSARAELLSTSGY